MQLGLVGGEAQLCGAGGKLDLGGQHRKRARDLRKAALEALNIPREVCREYAVRFSWAASTDAPTRY
mgnify:CR=1 FL=1